MSTSMSLATARSLLFAPGHEERKLQKALAAGADVVVADLEDAVPAGEKDAARDVARRVLGERFHPKPRGRAPERGRDARTGKPTWRP